MTPDRTFGTSCPVMLSWGGVAPLSGDALTTGERVVARHSSSTASTPWTTAAARMGFVFETPHGKTDPYPGVGFEWDYYGMENIPWNSLRILAP